METVVALLMFVNFEAGRRIYRASRIFLFFCSMPLQLVPAFELIYDAQRT